MKIKCYVIAIMFFVCIKLHGQVKLFIDSTYLTTVHNLDKKFLAGEIVDEGQENVLFFGPCLTVYGHITNVSDSIVTITQYPYPLVFIKYEYNGKMYYVRPFLDEINIKFNSNIIKLHQGKSVYCRFIVFLLTPQNNFDFIPKKEPSIQEKIENGKKLAKIAEEIIPRLQFDICVDCYPLCFIKYLLSS